MTIDLTVAVTAHAEDHLLRPTLRSVSAALESYRGSGRSGELLLVLDRPSPETLREAQLWVERTDGVLPTRLEIVDNGESGATRNAAARLARGTYLAFCDGDDLVSSNLYVEGHARLDSQGVQAVVHPAQVLSFGARAIMWNVRSSTDGDSAPLDLVRSNLWPSSVMGPRSIWLEHPYPELRPGSGFGPEDYAWNVKTAIAGIAHVTSESTVCFYRVREHGGVNNAHIGSLLPAFDIDAVAAGFPAPIADEAGGDADSEVAVSVWRRLRSRIRARALIARLRPVAVVGFRLVPRRWKPRVRHVVATMYQKVMRIRLTLTEVPPELVAELRSAAEFEPALSWTAERIATVETWVPPQDAYPEILAGLQKAVGATDVLICAPWVGVGGADLVTLNYARALASLPSRPSVTLLTTYLPERTLPHLIPGRVRHVQLDPLFRSLTTDRQKRLIAQAIEMSGAKLLLSINCFDVTVAMSTYAKSICSNREVYLSLFAFDRIGKESYPVNPITDDAQRSFLRDISGIITDNSVTASLAADILGRDDIMVVHPQSAGQDVHDFDNVVKQTAAYYDDAFSMERPFRVLWPHRIDKEKRPDALVAVAREARRRDLPVEFHVYGSRVLHHDGEDPLAAFADAGISYHGPYSGGLGALPTEDYHALLLTSESEGMPLVLAQSMLLGLPIVASAVGGVVDIVEHGVTGMLADGPTDVEGFVTAFEGLMASRELRQRIIRQGYELSARRHSDQAFGELVLSAWGGLFESTSTRGEAQTHG